MRHCERELEVVYSHRVEGGLNEVKWCGVCGFVTLVHRSDEGGVIWHRFPKSARLAITAQRVRVGDSGDAPLPNAGGPVKEQVSTVAPAKARPVNDPTLHELYGVMKPHRGWSGAS